MISAILAKAALSAPSKPALYFEGQTWTYGALIDEVYLRARFLERAGICEGARVAIVAANSPQWLMWYAAINTLNAVAVPVNPAYTSYEVRSILHAADLSLVILDSGNRGEVLDDILGSIAIDINTDVHAIGEDSQWRPPAAAPEGPAVIYFSSGSTGKPKGIVHTGRNLKLIVDCVSSTWRMTVDDVTLVAMPLAFIYASTVAWLTTVHVGGSAFLQARFDERGVAQAISDGLLTNIMGVPMMFRRILDATAAAPRNRLRFGLSSGDGLARALEEEFFAKFGCRVFEFFGLSEMPHVVSHALGRDARSKEFSCGRAVQGVDIEVRDEDGRRCPPGEVGELTCRSPFGFIGYFRDRGSTDAVMNDGWFSTGDLVREDEEGFIYFVERKKELIKSSGFNVLPSEVERVISGVAGVSEVAVVGAPHAERGQVVYAYVVPIAGSENRDAVKARILAECRSKLAKYKIPERIEFLSELPRGPTGKLQRKQLCGRPAHGTNVAGEAQAGGGVR